MAGQKTKQVDDSVEGFINKLQDGQKRKDSFAILDLMKKATGLEAKLWGTSIIGFGSYHYKYASGHEGDAPLFGFSPRKAALSLYFATEFPKKEELLKRLGKHKAAVACVYINKLADVDLAILEKMTIASVKHIQQLYPAQ